MKQFRKISKTYLGDNKILSKLLSTNDYNKRQSAIEDEIRKINLFGSLGVLSTAVVSYVLFGKPRRLASTKKTAPKPKRYQKEHFPNIFPKSGQIAAVAETNLREQNLRDKYNFINKVVSNCAQSVFYLELRDPLKKDPETGEPMITSNGSGFIISEDGYALTNAHVVLNKPQSTITAVMRDGKSYKVRVEDADMNIDLALLKIDTDEKLPNLEFGQTGDTNIGEWVIALGSPLSLSNSVTVGIVSCTDRPAEELGLKNYNMSYIQTDASITFGNSGGPLINLDGHVIGINNLRLTSGISFAIPVEYVRKFLDNTKYRMQVNKDAVPSKKLFGLTTISINPDVLDELLRENEIPQDVTEGLLIWKIILGTPAHKCGLVVGDIITHVNGMPVKKTVDFYNFCHGDITELTIIHYGEKKKVHINITENE